MTIRIRVSRRSVAGLIEAANLASIAAIVWAAAMLVLWLTLAR